MPIKKKIIVIIVIVLSLMGGLLKIVDSVAPISPIIFSRLHFVPFEKNHVGAQLIVGEDINKYTQIHWADPKKAFEYPERGLAFKFHYEGNRVSATEIVDILDNENRKMESIYFPSGEIQEVGWLDNGLFLHGTKDVSGSWKETDQDYYYALGAKEKQPIKNDGQKKYKGKNREWLLHPKNRSYLLETYCLSTAVRFPDNICKQWGASLMTPTKSTNILSFYHTFRQRLRIGWDDDNFYVKTRKPDVDLGFDEQKLAQQKMSIDRADSGDLMYIIPLKNLDKI